jgi:hypothetical protein
MINLNAYVERIWECETEEKKRSVFTEMVNASHATKAKKQLTLRQIQTLPASRLDSLAVNYAMAGEGLKVIK